MRLKMRVLLLGSALAAPANAFAQDTGTAGGTEQVLPEVVAEGGQDGGAYLMGTGADAGTTRITAGEIRARAAGSGDANQLLKALPTVQFSRDEGLATRENIQDIRPADLSISGGRYYENLITIDGIDANARVDITGTSRTSNALAAYELAGATAQSIWVDTNLVGEVTLRDSNVSAEYGRFTGGALDIKTRAPKREWGASANVSYTSDALTHYRVSPASRAALADDEMPARPSFEKWRYGVSLDVPVNPNIGLLLAYNRSTANVVYTRGAAYGATTFGQSSTSDNFMAKMEADLTGDLTLSGQFVYSPYRSEAASANGVANEVVSRGGGITSQLRLAHSGASDWSLSANLTHSDTGRDASPFNYSVPSWSTNGSVCSNTNCTIGGFGDIDQTQDVYNLNGRWSRPIGPGTLAMGFDYQHIEAMRSRPVDGGAYSRGTSQSATAAIVCADGNSLTCVTGEYALTQFALYSAYRAEVALDSVAGWAEYSARLGAFSLRGGLRYDYESFLGNHNFAPRLSASYALPWDGWSVTLGANRYYGRSMLAYALREQYPASATYLRTGTSSGGLTTYADTDWYLSSMSYSTSYSGSKTKTPYSDELSATLSARILGGNLRVKGIYREGKDEFVRAAGERETITLPNGKTSTVTRFVVTNTGFSSYRGASVEWTRRFGKHDFAINTNFSKTKSSNDNYLDAIDSELFDDTPVLFQGNVTTLAELSALNQRDDMAAPLIINATWTARWRDERLTTNVNLRYRSGFDQIEDTGESQTVDGTAYDVYDYIHYPKAIDVNLNAQFEVIRSAMGVLTAETRIANLLDRIPSPNSVATTQPYQFGRSFWVGLNYRF